MEKTSKKLADTHLDAGQPSKYFEGVGRRKTSVARARLFAAKGKEIQIIVNERPFKEYFPTIELQSIAEDAFHKSDLAGHYKVTAKVNGGGINTQAEALRHGIARALLAIDPELRKKLKVEGFLKRDPRAKERRKF